MIPISAAFKAHLAQSHTTLCTIIRIQRKDGQVFGFTDHDADITYNDGSGLVTYLAAVGYQPKDVSSSSDMTVDNSEYDGILNSPSITEADMLLGLWDDAGIRVSYINWSDTTMGVLRIPGWKLGKVTTKRNMFTAEIRGIMQAYSVSLGENTSPGCRANLGDARCKVDLTPFTVTGTLIDVTPDQMTLYDTGRTEPGPAGGIAIVGVSNSNPGHVTLTSGGGATFTDGQAVQLSEIVGPDLLNVITIIRNISGDVWDLGIDTSNTAIYPVYVSGGLCTPLGGTSGYFDFGVITMTSGAANGLSADVLSYVPGQWTLQLPFDMPVAIGDTYTMKAGCDKSENTCFTRFSNVANMRAEPYLPGTDKIVQIGKQG